MTAFDRLEPRIPELMDELAPAQVPDYFDDMLRQTARTRQRPAWSSLERWLPMGVIARTDTIRQVPWRPIAIAAVLVVAATAALVLIAGSQRRLPPAPFGPTSRIQVGDPVVTALVRCRRPRRSGSTSPRAWCAWTWRRPPSRDRSPLACDVITAMPRPAPVPSGRRTTSTTAS